MLPEIPTVNKCFYSEGKFPRENKTKQKISIPLMKMKTTSSPSPDEACSCMGGEQKPGYFLGQAVNPAKPEAIHGNYRANGRYPVVKLVFSFYLVLSKCSSYCPFLNIPLSIFLEM